MAGHLHLPPDAPHGADPVDEVGHPFDAHVFAAVHALFDPGAVALDHVVVLGRREQGAQAVFGLELLMAGGGVLGDAHDDRAGGREVIGRRGEALGFGRAAGGVVLGIEIDHHRLALERNERDPPVIGRQIKLGRLVAGG